MKRLPLYVDEREEPAPWERETAYQFDSGCTRCELGFKSPQPRHRCMPPEGHPGGLLVVGDFPSREEDMVGRPFYSQSGRYLRELIDQHWKGPVAYDYSIRCAPGRNSINDRTFAECAAYMSRAVEVGQPQRIIALGGQATRMLLGRKLQVLTNRKSYAFTSSGVPVFALPSPGAALRNRFVRCWLEEDLAHALTSDAPTPPWGTRLRLVETEADALAAEQEILASGVMVFDVETVGQMFDAVWFRVISLAACSLWSDEAWVWSNAAIENASTRAPLVRLLVSPHVGKIGSNVKYDMLACRTDPRIASIVAPITGDTRVWRKMLFSDADAALDTMMNLDGMGGSKGEAKKQLELAKKSLDKDKKAHGDGAGMLPGILPPAMQAWLRLGGDKNKYVYGMLPPDVLHRYNARDTVATRRLVVLLKPQIDALPHVRHIWESVVGPAVPAIEQVQAWGMPVSVPNMDVLGTFLRTRLDASLRRVHAHKPGLDPSKDDDLRAWLYGPIKEGGLALKPKKFTKKKNLPAVDAESLEHLEGAHPIIRDLLDWAKLDKLRGTYVDGMREHIVDGRIHPSLNLDGTRSGRLSCSDPNLQNIPRAKGLAEAKMVKDCFRAERGNLLLQADYSQLELRVAAMLSGDEKMIEIFKSGEDYHLRCAKIISQTAWGVHPDNVLPGGEYRSKAKGFVFGLLYGMTDGGLARRMGCTKEEAARIRKAVLGSFPRLAAWIKECLDEARRTGWTYTWWDGRRARQRTLWQIAQTGDEDSGKRITAENSSYNTPCQGTASDFCLASVVGTVHWLLEELLPAKLVITVHDSIILEVAKDALSEVAYGLHSIMTQWNSNGVPLVVDMEVGEAWGTLYNYRYHAVQQDGQFDKRFNEAKFVDRGVEAVWVRRDRDAAPWLHHYEFNPVVVPEEDAVAWLHKHASAQDLTRPWSNAA